MTQFLDMDVKEGIGQYDNFFLQHALEQCRVGKSLRDASKIAGLLQYFALVHKNAYGLEYLATHEDWDIGTHAWSDPFCKFQDNDYRLEARTYSMHEGFDLANDGNRDQLTHVGEIVEARELVNAGDQLAGIYVFDGKLHSLFVSNKHLPDSSMPVYGQGVIMSEQ